MLFLKHFSIWSQLRYCITVRSWTVLPFRHSSSQWILKTIEEYYQQYTCFLHGMHKILCSSTDWSSIHMWMSTPFSYVWYHTHFQKIMTSPQHFCVAILKCKWLPDNLRQLVITLSKMILDFMHSYLFIVLCQLYKDWVWSLVVNCCIDLHGHKYQVQHPIFVEHFLYFRYLLNCEYLS